MKKILIFFVLFCLAAFIFGCDFEGDEQRQQIAKVLMQTKEAINNKDQAGLEKLVSDKYSYDDLDKEKFIESILNQNLNIAGYNLEKITLKEDNTQAKAVVEWRMDGGVTSVRVPVFQQVVTSINMTIYSRVRFYLEKNEDKKWQIVMAEQLDKVQEGSYGELQPRITELSYIPENPLRGEAVEMRVKLVKAQEEDSSIFLSINGILVGGYSLNGLEKYLLSDPFIQMFRVPADFPQRAFYEIKVLTFEGRVNPLKIDSSELLGLQYKVILLPVR
ncbi:hypothetical protein ACFL5G_02140 [Candidatus Margulisiibacteriota bacterium]